MSRLDFYAFKPGAHDFYRCVSCNTIFNYQQEQDRIQKISEESRARICPCGSRKYKATMPLGLEWLRPNVLGYSAKLVLARGVAPKAPKFVVDLIEKIV